MISLIVTMHHSPLDNSSLRGRLMSRGLHNWLQR